MAKFSGGPAGLWLSPLCAPDGASSGPVLPSFSGSGKPVDSGEVTWFLDRFAEMLGISSAGRGPFSSHSLKATLLAVCAKDGMNLLSRQLLGYHVARGEYSALNYGRDNLAAPVEQLEAVLETIRLGQFLPDALRGARRAQQNPVPLLDTFEKFMSLRTARSKLEGLNVDTDGWDSWPTMSGLDVGVVGEVPDGASGEVPASLNTTIAGEVPAMRAGEVPSGSSGEVPARSSLGEVPEPDQVSDATSGSDEDLEARGPPDRAEVDPDKVAGRVVARFQSIPGALLSSDVLVVVQHLTRKTFHKLSSDPSRTCCGKWVSENFQRAVLTEDSWPRCCNRNCFG